MRFPAYGIHECEFSQPSAGLGNYTEATLRAPSAPGSATSLKAGMSFGYGWINYVENCRFSGNGIALEIYNSVNGWVR